MSPHDEIFIVNVFPDYMASLLGQSAYYDFFGLTPESQTDKYFRYLCDDVRHPEGVVCGLIFPMQLVSFFQIQITEIEHVLMDGSPEPTVQERRSRDAEDPRLQVNPKASNVCRHLEFQPHVMNYRR